MAECGCSWHDNSRGTLPTRENQNKLFAIFFFLYRSLILFTTELLLHLLLRVSVHKLCHSHTHTQSKVVDSNLRNWIETRRFKETFCLRFSIKCNVSVCAYKGIENCTAPYVVIADHECQTAITHEQLMKQRPKGEKHDSKNRQSSSR